MAGHLGGQDVVVREEEGSDVLGVERLAARGEAGEVCEQDRDRPALLVDRGLIAAAMGAPQALQNLEPPGLSVEQVGHATIAPRIGGRGVSRAG
jgi:hypothetical protein